jgi:hypothetical protein
MQRDRHPLSAMPWSLLAELSGPEAERERRRRYRHPRQEKRVPALTAERKRRSG